MIIRETTDDIRTERLLKLFTNAGHMKDIEDLTAKYKNKPEQLNSILNTTYQLECKIRRVTLYADPECTQETLMQMEQIKTRKLSSTTEHTRKKSKGGKHK